MGATNDDSSKPSQADCDDWKKELRRKIEAHQRRKKVRRPIITLRSRSIDAPSLGAIGRVSKTPQAPPSGEREAPKQPASSADRQEAQAEDSPRSLGEPDSGLRDAFARRFEQLHHSEVSIPESSDASEEPVVEAVETEESPSDERIPSIDHSEVTSGAESDTRGTGGDYGDTFDASRAAEEDADAVEADAHQGEESEVTASVPEAEEAPDSQTPPQPSDTPQVEFVLDDPQREDSGRPSPPPAGPAAEPEGGEDRPQIVTFAEKAVPVSPTPNPFRVPEEAAESRPLDLLDDLASYDDDFPDEDLEEGGAAVPWVPRDIFFSRILAGLVDFLLPILTGFLFAFAASQALSLDFFSASAIQIALALSSGFYVVGCLFFLLLAGQTPGMLLTGLRLLHREHQRLPFFPTLLRVLILPPVVVTLAGLLWGLFDPWGRCLHDRLAQTRVVNVD